MKKWGQAIKKKATELTELLHMLQIQVLFQLLYETFLSYSSYGIMFQRK